MGELESTREILADISTTTWNIATFVIMIMCAACMAALAVLYVIDNTRYVKEKDAKIAELLRTVQELKRSREDGYKKNLQTADVTDTIFTMYINEKEIAEANEARFAEWDAKQVKRINALENQLRENGIEPIKWNEIKNIA
jgi:hypothetical protein